MKGVIPHNKGVKQATSPKVFETTFKKGNIPPQQNPEGTITLQKDVNKNGKVTYYQSINIDPLTGKRKSNYQYSRYVMEQHIGRYLEKGEIVYHVDGDPLNDNLENLLIVNRAFLARNNKKKSYG